MTFQVDRQGIGKHGCPDAIDFSRRSASRERLDVTHRVKSDHPSLKFRIPKAGVA
jgi:hypothetical protein